MGILFRFIIMSLMMMTLSACGIFSGSERGSASSGNARNAGEGQQGAEQQGQQQSQQNQQGSLIDQELRKQYQMYKEIIDYQKKQDQKVKTESEKRVQLLKKQSQKASDQQQQEEGSEGRRSEAESSERGQSGDKQ